MTFHASLCAVDFLHLLPNPSSNCRSVGLMPRGAIAHTIWDDEDELGVPDRVAQLAGGGVPSRQRIRRRRPLP